MILSPNRGNQDDPSKYSALTVIPNTLPAVTSSGLSITVILSYYWTNMIGVYELEC
jgi:hypothetical protein